MKLNNDCVRDLLLYIEEHSTANSLISISHVTITGYDIDELVYTASRLEEAGYISAKITKYVNGGADAHISSLTWNGHKFLDNIRDDGVWKTTKEKVSKVSSVSLNIIESVASQVLTNLINQQIRQ